MIIRNLGKLIFVFLLFCSCGQKEIRAFEEKINDTSEDTSHNHKDFPEANGIVTDLEDLFTIEEEMALFELLYKYEEETSREVAILSTPTFLDYDDPSKYASDVGNYWGVGKADKNNGLLIVVSKTLRKTTISSGYATEKSLSNRYLDSLIHYVLIPEFKNENFYQGVYNAIEDVKLNWVK